MPFIRVFIPKLLYNTPKRGFNTTSFINYSWLANLQVVMLKGENNVYRQR
jgi:hypothetical protein